MSIQKQVQTLALALMELQKLIPKMMQNQSNLNNRMTVLESEGYVGVERRGHEVEIEAITKKLEALDAHQIAMAGRIVEMEVRQDPMKHNPPESDFDFTEETHS